MRGVIEADQLKGLVIERVECTDDESIKLHLVGGAVVTFYHDQDCCESVRIFDEGVGLRELKDKILSVTETVIQDGNPDGVVYSPSDSYTWTVYDIVTASASVKVIWFGESNGYYGEGVYISHDDGIGQA